jgi:hypothetical protein
VGLLRSVLFVIARMVMILGGRRAVLVFVFHYLSFQDLFISISH